MPCVLARPTMAGLTLHWRGGAQRWFASILSKNMRPFAVERGLKMRTHGMFMRAGGSAWPAMVAARAAMEA